MSFTRVSKEAEDVLMEILEHEHDSDYWKIRFDTKRWLFVRKTFGRGEGC